MSAPTAYARPSTAYRDNAVLTASPERLVVMLYDGAGRFLAQAAAAMRDGDFSTSNGRLQRAEAIVNELNVTLDMSYGDVSERLRSIYLWSLRSLSESRVERNAEKIDTVRRLLGELRESWAQIAA